MNKYVNGGGTPSGRLLSFMRAFYVVLIYITCISTYGTAYTKLKAASVLFILFAFFDFCVIFRKENADLAISAGKRYLIYITFLAGMSYALYTVKMADISVIKRGTEKLFFQMLSILLAVSAMYMFGKEAAVLTYKAFALFNFTAMVLSFWQNKSTIVRDTAYFINSGGEAVGFYRTLELSETTFAFGLLLIYFIADGFRKNLKRISVCMFFFLIGYKRIGMFGAILSAVFCFLFRKTNGKRLRAAGRICCIIFIIVAILFVASIRSGIFVRIMNETGTDMMGRQNLYSYMEQFYKISPFYIGHGYESVTMLLKGAGDIKIGDTLVSRMTALHNDYLTMYIEMGSAGFVLWLSYFLIYLERYFEKYSDGTYMVYIMCTIYLFTTYLTDNTSKYYLAQALYRMLPLCIAAGKEEQDAGKNDHQDSRRCGDRDGGTRSSV